MVAPDQDAEESRGGAGALVPLSHNAHYQSLMLPGEGAGDQFNQ
jgi:hypothetical protein